MFDIRALFKSTFVYTLLGFLPMASAFVLTPVYTKHMQPEEYGMVALSNIFQAYLSIFIAIGIDSAFTRFFFKYPKRVITDALLSTSLISILLISAVLYLIFLFIGPSVFSITFDVKEFTYSAFGHFIFVTTVFSIAYSIIAQYYRDTENLKAFTVLAITYFICVTIGSYIGIVVYKGGAQGSIVGKMVGTLITMLIYLYVFFNKIGFIFKIKYARQMYIYGYPLVIYSLLAITFDSMDKFFLNKYFSLNDLGQYNLAFVVASTIGIVLNSLQSAISPNIYKLSNLATIDSQKQINVIYRYMLWTTLFITVSCIAVSYPVITYFINKNYHSCIIYIPLLAIGWLGRSYFMIYSNPLFLHGKTTFLPLINGISVLIGIIANFIFINLWGIIGICFAVVVTKLSQAFFTVLFVKRTQLFNVKEYNFPEIHLTAILTLFSIILISSNLIPDNVSTGLKYLIPLTTFSISFVFIKVYKKRF
jgi:O-antigen/teichoic acid export membrane protein